MPLKRSWLNYHVVVTYAMEGRVGQGAKIHYGGPKITI